MNRTKIGDFVIGTDGMTGDMIASLRSHFLLGSLPNGFPGLQKTFFENTRKARQRYFPETGTLNIGTPADITVLDYRPHTPFTPQTILGHLIFGVKGGNAYMTIVDGNILFHDGKITFIDEEEVITKARNVSEKLHKRYYV